MLLSIIYFLIKEYGYTSLISAIFAKGNNFCDLLVPSMHSEAFPKWVLLLKERLCPNRSKFFPLIVDPY